MDPHHVMEELFDVGSVGVQIDEALHNAATIDDVGGNDLETCACITTS